MSSSDYDTVIVTFTDGSSTTLSVHIDKSIQDAIVQLCEDNGRGIDEVLSYRIAQDY